MAIHRSGKGKHKREGRTTPHSAGGGATEEPVPREGQAEPAGRTHPDPLVSEYQDEAAGSDLPGLKKTAR